MPYQQSRTLAPSPPGGTAPAPYFHVTVTVPKELHAALRADKRDGYAMLMRAAAGGGNHRTRPRPPSCRQNRRHPRCSTHLDPAAWNPRLAMSPTPSGRLISITSKLRDLPSTPVPTNRKTHSIRDSHPAIYRSGRHRPPSGRSCRGLYYNLRASPGCSRARSSANFMGFCIWLICMAPACSPIVRAAVA